MFFSERALIYLLFLSFVQFLDLNLKKVRYPATILDYHLIYGRKIGLFSGFIRILIYLSHQVVPARISFAGFGPAHTALDVPANGTQHKLGFVLALVVHTGEITAQQMDRNNSDNFLKFLKYLDRTYRNVQLH